MPPLCFHHLSIVQNWWTSKTNFDFALFDMVEPLVESFQTTSLRGQSTNNTNLLIWQTLERTIIQKDNALKTEKAKRTILKEDNYLKTQSSKRTILKEDNSQRGQSSKRTILWKNNHLKGQSSKRIVFWEHNNPKEDNSGEGPYTERTISHFETNLSGSKPCL